MSLQSPAESKPLPPEPLARPWSRPDLSGRLHFLDALRGLAALGVMLFHFFSVSVSPIHNELAQTLPVWTGWLLSHMYTGVEIFFVLSGFVIALSMDENRHNLRYAGNFIIRRSLRLDPPYWTAIFVMLAYYLIRWPEMWHGFYQMFSGVRGLLANMFYVQNLHFIYPARSVLDVSWTLCLEVQFYLSYLLILLTTYYISARTGRYREPLARLLPLLAITSIGVWSLLHWTNDGGVGFTGRSWMFFMGVGLYAALKQGFPMAAVVATLLAIAGWFMVRVDIDGLIAVATALAIYAVAVSGRLSTALAYRPLLYLGRISYSLYLLHTVIGITAMTMIWEALDGSLAAAWLSWAAAVVLSLVAAELLHRFVEAPSNRLSRRLKQKPPANEATERAAASPIT